MTWLYIFLGGGLGAVSRYALAAGVQKLASETKLQQFPLGILACNLLGSLLIGVIIGIMAAKHDESWAKLHPFAVAGFLGAFTTFSTFALDTHRLFSESSPTMAICNILVSVIGSLIAVWLGFRLVHLF